MDPQKLKSRNGPTTERLQKFSKGTFSGRPCNSVQCNSLLFVSGGHFFLNVQFPPHAFISVPFLSTCCDAHFGVSHRETPEQKIYFAKKTFYALLIFFLAYTKRVNGKILWWKQISCSLMILLLFISTTTLEFSRFLFVFFSFLKKCHPVFPHPFFFLNFTISPTHV